MLIGSRMRAGVRLPARSEGCHVPWPDPDHPGDHLSFGGLSGRFGGYGYGYGHSGLGLGGVILVVLLVLILLHKI